LDGRIIFKRFENCERLQGWRGVKKGRALFLGIAAIGGLAGCSVGPDYRRPEIDPPKTWTSASGRDEWPGLTWWRDFHADDLDRLMKAAHDGNFDLAIAVARLKQANAQATIAGAPLLPQIDAGAQAERLRDPPTTPTGSKLFSATLSASYELDFWGQLRDQAEAARLTAAASLFDRETAELTLQSAVANSYFALLSLNERIDLADHNLRASEDVLDAYQARLEVGAASALDVAQQETVVATQRAVLPPLIEQQRQARDALALLVGIAPDGLNVPAGTLERVTLPGVAPGLPSGLLRRRPDVQSAEARLQASNQTVKAATAALFPSITLTAQGGSASSSLSDLFKPAGLFYSLIAGAAQPIFHGGALEGGQLLAEGQYDEQVATYQKAVVSAFVDVEDALAAIEQEGRREEADKVEVSTAQRAYDIAQAQLYGGTIDILTVLNTQRALFQAQDDLAQARLAHAQAVVGLFKALGGGWQSPEEG
jgi:NodT family efflux transporter outer membrane factor (OMF) lipoprotein